MSARTLPQSIAGESWADIISDARVRAESDAENYMHDTQARRASFVAHWSVGAIAARLEGVYRESRQRSEWVSDQLGKLLGDLRAGEHLTVDEITAAIEDVLDAIARGLK
jgi:hypothetical protein